VQSDYAPTVPYKPKPRDDEYAEAVALVIVLFADRAAINSALPAAIASALSHGATTTELGKQVGVSTETIRKLGKKGES
jgi:hypothetical protein